MKRKAQVKKREPGKRGPRSKSARPLDRNSIVSAGLAMTKSLPLRDVSIVRLSNELVVTPASIHYYLEGRQALTAGIVNRFFQELLAVWPAPRETPKTTLETVLRAFYEHYVRYPGIAAFFAAQNRFDLLVQSAHEPGSESLYRFLERYFFVVESCGFGPKNAAVFAFVLIQFAISAAHATASHQLPGEHREVGAILSGLPESEYPAIHRMQRNYLGLTGEAAFETGLQLLLGGMFGEK